MACRNKKANDVSKENEEFEELVKDVLKIHNKLLEMGFEGIADDALEMHNNLLGTKQKETKSDIGIQIKKLEKLKDESIQRLKIEMGIKNISDYELKFLIELTTKNFDEQINALKKGSVEIF